jgi:hypothetical protein
LLQLRSTYASLFVIIFFFLEADTEGLLELLTVFGLLCFDYDFDFDLDLDLDFLIILFYGSLLRVSL